MSERLLTDVKAHLRQPHPIAFERVGFVACGGGATGDGVSLLARSFHPVRDDDYEPGGAVGARINGRAVQSALSLAYNARNAMIFVHEHAHRGIPGPSKVDIDCWRELIPNFWHVRPELPHGALILSEDKAMGLVWVPGDSRVFRVTDFSIVGRRLLRWKDESDE